MSASGTAATACRPSCACPAWSAPAAISRPGRGDRRRAPRCRDRLSRARAIPGGRATSAATRPEACVRDVMDACAALHIHHATLIGTSFGGLLDHGPGRRAAGLVRAVVLNDIGPEIGTEGADFVRDFVGDDPALRKPGRLRRLSARQAAAAVAGHRRRLAPDGGTDLSARPRRPLAPGLGHPHRQPAERADRRTCGRCSARWRMCRCCWCAARSATSCCRRP